MPYQSRKVGQEDGRSNCQFAGVCKENYAECVERIQKLEQQLIGERNNLNQLSGAHAALQALQSPQKMKMLRTMRKVKTINELHKENHR